MLTTCDRSSLYVMLCYVDVFVVWGVKTELSMKLLMFSTYTPFRAVRVFAAQLNTVSESTNYMYCVNSVRWLNLTVASSINLSVVTVYMQLSNVWVDNFFITKYPEKLTDGNRPPYSHSHSSNILCMEWRA